MSRTTLADLDLDGEQTVWKCGRGSGNPKIIHLEHDCPHLVNTNRVFDTKAQLAFDDSVICRRCLNDDIDTSHANPYEVVNRLDAMDPEDLGLSPLGDTDTEGRSA